MLAAGHNKNPEVITTLLKNGADAKAKDNRGKTAFDYAQDSGNLKGTDAYRQLFFELVRTGTARNIEAAINKGADVNAPDKNGVTSLMYAAEWTRSPEAIATLLKAGTDIKARTNDGMTALMYAAEFNQDPGVVSTLLKAGAEIEARDKDGVTPLMYAVGVYRRLMDQLVSGLMESFVGDSSETLDLFADDPLETRVSSPTPVQQWNANSKVVMALLSAGADVNAQDKDGKTPLICAARNQSPEVIIALLKAGAAVNARSTDRGIPEYEDGGMTPLIAAAGYNKNTVVITTLLKAGADVRSQDKNGQTALIYAVRFNSNPNVITTLLKAGADPKTKDNSGMTALDYAKSNTKLKGTDVLRQLQGASR